MSRVWSATSDLLCLGDKAKVHRYCLTTIQVLFRMPCPNNLLGWFFLCKLAQTWHHVLLSIRCPRSNTQGTKCNNLYVKECSNIGIGIHKLPINGKGLSASSAWKSSTGMDILLSFRETMQGVFTGIDVNPPPRGGKLKMTSPKKWYSKATHLNEIPSQNYSQLK